MQIATVDRCRGRKKACKSDLLNESILIMAGVKDSR
jgi:hypothetical protein